MHNYTKDSQLNLYTRKEFDGIAYSDGHDIEQRLLHIMEKSTDRSVFSNELRSEITDWASEYHFSRQRHCIVRPLGIKPGDKVLELGCGCGAITRYLGELGAEVTAIEGGKTRARIAATRCADLPNVRVILEDLTQLQLEGQFDWILLIGVLEYASVFVNGPNPAQRYITSLNPYLAKTGSLCIAIENKLGLKYFNACGEDHLGTPYSGIQNLYEGNEPTTFGKRELAALLTSCGYQQTIFLYPFPDYKLPKIFLTEAALSDKKFNAAELLATTYSRDYRGNDYRLFNDPLVARQLIENGLLGELSNSFLVTSRKVSIDTAAETNQLAWSFAVDRRIHFTTETQITRQHQDIIVRKNKLSTEPTTRTNVGSFFLEHTTHTEPYIPGPLAIWKLTTARTKQGNLTKLVDSLAPWICLILDESIGNGPDLKNYFLDGKFIDLTPFNVIEGQEKLFPIDQEWHLSQPFPTGWLITRGILTIFINQPGFEPDIISIEDIITMLCAKKGLKVRSSEIEEWLALEAELQYAVSGIRHPPVSPASYTNRLKPLTRLANEQEKSLLELGSKVGALEAQLNGIRTSLSWKITSPLRYASRQLKKIVKAH